MSHVATLAFGFLGGAVTGAFALLLVALTIRRTDIGDTIVGVVALILVAALIPSMFLDPAALSAVLGALMVFVPFIFMDDAFE